MKTEPKFDHPLICTEVQEFLSELHSRFNHRRQALLLQRQERQQQFDKGIKPDFLIETRTIREGNWHAGTIPEDITDRRVEITGPVDRKMIINALNSGAKVFMADFEDSNSPTWENCINGQANLIAAVNHEIDFQDPTSNKFYKLNKEHAVLMVRPRGWHLDEAHFLVDEEPISASLFDFGLYVYHNAKNLLAKNTAPYFYLPKLESHKEARLWNQVFDFTEELLGLPKGCIKATVLIETITAAFEMDEIIFELKDHIVGLNCGRWDYIFSFIKKFRNHADCLLPDRQEVTMLSHFLHSYVQLLIQTCHKRGIHAMGGMAAQIPIKGDEKANQLALDKVYLDKLREVKSGHDGTWVAHPGLISVALQAFDSYMPGPNQLDYIPDVQIRAQDLLTVPQGKITEQGIRNNLSVGIQYLASWLHGNGCVPINHLMEDAATAEICRSQLWQWIRFNAEIEDGTLITKELVSLYLEEEFAKVLATNPMQLPTQPIYDAKLLFLTMLLNPAFDEFLTLPAYTQLIRGVDDEQK